ncbi:hypothetical protein A9G43_08970 [Gilliamella sp. Occ3-1]|nr:hypothetical protein A9G43_08970 [Gilliamella apicola]
MQNEIIVFNKNTKLIKYFLLSDLVYDLSVACFGLLWMSMELAIKLKEKNPLEPLLSKVKMEFFG